MDAFEEWYMDANYVDEVNRIDAEAAWRAALDWAINGLERYGHSENMGRTIPVVALRQELGGE